MGMLAIAPRLSEKNRRIGCCSGQEVRVGSLPENRTNVVIFYGS